MPDSSFYDPRLALYFAGQWSRLRGKSDAIPGTLDWQLYGLGDFAGDDEWGEKYWEAIKPGKDGGRNVLLAVGDCTDGVGRGITETIGAVVANDHRTGDLIR